MIVDAPRFLLQTDALYSRVDGEWRFVLTNQDTGSITAARDMEPGMGRDRLALMALVRGLEAIPAPARVTLLIPSRSVRDGLRTGLAIWKNNEWKWERFGRLVTVRDADLWRRVEQALEIHHVECRSWRLCGTVAADDARPAAAAHNPTTWSDRGDPERPGTSKVRGSGHAEPRYEPRLAEAGSALFLREPALLVVRKRARRNRLQLNPPSPARGAYAQASAG